MSTASSDMTVSANGYYKALNKNGNYKSSSRRKKPFIARVYLLNSTYKSTHAIFSSLFNFWIFSASTWGDCSQFHYYWTEKRERERKKCLKPDSKQLKRKKFTFRLYECFLHCPLSKFTWFVTTVTIEWLKKFLSLRN